MLEVLSNKTPSHTHEAAALHVRGKAEYIDDRPPEAQELVVGLVYSQHAHARILGIDLSALKQCKGYIRVFSAKDLHHNLWGSIIYDQPLLAETEVFYVGEVILVVAAASNEDLQKALRLIRVDYAVLPAILSVNEAISQNSFIGSEKKIERGSWQAGLNGSPHRIKAQFVIEGADHFYLESNVAIAYPRDGGIIELHSSTQHPSETQHIVAEALGLPLKDVVCQATRLGGAFGGKESQAAPFAAYAALVAHYCQRPARIVLNKDDDMLITGKRNPFQINYDIGFKDDGEIIALSAQLYGDGGAYADLSTAILERALTHVDNAYFLPAVQLRGQVCRTHVHPHTAFRGFGGPKGVALIEHAIESIAHHLGLDAFDVRLKNCYHGAERNRTPYGQLVEGDRLLPLLHDLAERCQYRQRRAALASSAKASSFRGLALTPVKFGISFITRFLNQGNAFIHLHQDSSFQVSTGAVEMGQGVHTRIAGLIAGEFGVPLASIRIMPTRTDKNANTSATAASSGTDINGSAALNACYPLKDRLARMYKALIDIDPQFWPSKTIGLGLRDDLDLSNIKISDVIFKDSKIFTQAKPETALPFAAVVREAYYNRVSLSEYGFYKTDGLTFNKVSGQGNAFQYYTEGAACSEVEINRYTGEVKVLRTDILMDLGRPINQALDFGQVRGAFIQGMGWMTTEQLVYSDKGRLLSHSPSTYKIPSVQDIPRIFNINLLNSSEARTMHKGRAVGEPPLLLCFSVWTAIMDALRNLRPDGDFPSLSIPATRERILRKICPEDFAAWETNIE